jgi:hypothetical protein
MRRRPQLTVKEVMSFLAQCDPNAKVFISPSRYCEDMPKNAHEYIDEDRKIKCVAVETHDNIVTFGYAEK